MTRPLLSVDADQKVLSVYKRMEDRNQEIWGRKRLAVLNEGRVIGIISREEIYEGAARADPDLTIQKIASSVFHTIRDNELGYEALRLMTLNDVSFLIVTDYNDLPVGYISRGDIARAQKHKIEDETIIERGLIR